MQCLMPAINFYRRQECRDHQAPNMHSRQTTIEQSEAFIKFFLEMESKLECDNLSLTSFEVKMLVILNQGCSMIPAYERTSNNSLTSLPSIGDFPLFSPANQKPLEVGDVRVL